MLSSLINHYFYFQIRSSNQSIASTSKNKMNINPITIQKTIRAKHKRKRKTKDTIKKLFDQLRRDSKSTLDSPTQSCESSVIEIEDSILNNTVVTANVSTTGPVLNVPEIVRSGNVTGVRMKDRKLGKRQSKSNTIVINDDEPCMSTAQKNIYLLHHSTPIKKKPSIEDLIRSANNELLAASNELLDNSNHNDNKTKEINASSFLTIDLTTDSFNRSNQPTIIDLDNSNNQNDCVLTSVRYVLFF